MLITVNQRALKNPSIKAEDVPIGAKISFRKIIGDKISELRINAYYEGEEIGTISEGEKLLATGTKVLEQSLYDSLPDEFEGIVRNNQKLVAKSVMYVLAVEVGDDTDSVEENKFFRFKFAGSKMEYPGRTKVLEEYMKDPKNTFVELVIHDEFLACKLNGELAGRFGNKNDSGCSTVDDALILKDLLKNSTEPLEGKVDDVKGKAFYVSLSISGEVFKEKERMASKAKVVNIKTELLDKKDADGNPVYNAEVLDNIEDYLLANGFNADYITDIFSTYKEYDDEFKPYIISEPKTRFKDEDQLLLSAYSALKFKYNILCSGEKGSGKNTFIDTWAWILQRPLLSYSVNAQTDKLDLLGSNTLDAEVIDGSVVNKITFSKEALIKAMESGAIINIDEINFAEPGITSILHAIADDRRAIEVPGYKYVQADDNFVIMATMNLDYQGTNELNEALADRFVDIRFPETDSIFEILELNCPGVKKEVMKQADKVYTSILSEYKDASNAVDSSCITIRGYIQAVNMSTVIGLKKALIMGVADKIRDNDYRSKVIEVINSFIA